MPRREGTAFEPGRARDRERKRAAGASATGVMENRFDAHAAPSGSLFVTGGMSWAMMLLRGRARPRMPLKSGARGSDWTSLTAAGDGGEMRDSTSRVHVHTERLVIDGIAAQRHIIPNYGPRGRTFKVGDGEVFPSRTRPAGIVQATFGKATT
jgi:hypothetical protein